MDSKYICLAAYKNIPPDEKYDLFDLYLYHTMRLLYAEYQAELCTKEEAAAYKLQVIEQWQKGKQGIRPVEMEQLTL